jgi:hypothetical protein
VRPGDLTVNVIVEIAFANNLVARSVPKARLVSASRTEEGGAVHIQAAIRERETSFSALRKSYKWDRGERRFLATMCLNFFLCFCLTSHGGGKRCSHKGCSKSAVGGSLTCTSHGGGRRCAVAGCDKSAQSATKYCVKHGGGKKCSHVGCIKVARGRTQFCAAVSEQRCFPSIMIFF